jgi:hypothetical protein
MSNADTMPLCNVAIDTKHASRAAAANALAAAAAANAAALGATPHARETRDIFSSIFHISAPLSNDDYRAAMSNKKERKQISEVTIRLDKSTPTVKLPFFNFTKQEGARGQLGHLRSATWAVLFDSKDEHFEFMSVSKNEELKAAFNIQHCVLVRISRRFVLGFYYFGKPLRQSTLFEKGIGGKEAPVYACAVLGNEPGNTIFPNRAITYAQLQAHDKKVERAEKKSFAQE